MKPQRHVRLSLLTLALLSLTVLPSTAQFLQQGSKLVGTGAAVGGAEQGYSVSISADGNTAIVGGVLDNIGVGAAWLYTRSGGAWTQQGGKLVGTGAVGGSLQGWSVSISADGNTAIVGGFDDNFSAGAAWVYTRSAGVWTQQGSKLVGTGAVGNARQGYTVSLSADGNTAIVGGYADNSSAGATWVYTLTGGVWTQQGSKLVGTGAVGVAQQGSSVSLSADGNSAIVGGYNDNGTAGAAWVYTRSGGIWTQQGSKLVGTGAVGPAAQGWSVSISADGNTAIVGGWYDDHPVGAAWVYSLPGSPVTTAISDIANDQGGQVRVEWDKSVYDHIFSSPQVSSYSLWRRSPSGSMAPVVKSAPPELLLSDSSMLGFDYVGTVPALQSPHYQTVLPTLEDSSSSGTPYFTYLVVAHTTDLDYYYVSDVDSGYSVDNLVPIPPAGLIASVEPGPEVNLIWNSPTDPDVGHYNVYRSTTSGFTPGAGNKIGTSTSTSFTDTSPVEGVPSYYRIIAVDIHDNESTPSNEAEAAVTVNRQFSVQEKWNIVAVPLAMGDYTKTVLFPSAATNAFTFEDGYVAYGILENGRGYWMKFSSSELISHSGLERMEDIVTVAAGWNMVGSLSISIPVSTIGSIPGAIVTSSFYGYDAGYSSSETLEPGKGYWVKVSEAGQLVMTSSSTVPASNRIRIEDNGELPPPPPDVLNADVPDAYSLEQNYPNPFNPVSSISFVLPVAGQVTLTVFNMLGQEVAVLVNEVQGPGYKTVSFDASNLPSGVYTYRITAGTFTDAKKMLLIR